MNYDLKNHEAEVYKLAQTIKGIKESGRPFTFKKNSVNHFVPNPFEKESETNVIDLRPLCHLLHVDTNQQIAVAEPGLTFHDLARSLLPLGFMPPTVPELKTISLGGAIAGCSVESLSYKIGGFHDSCLEYEVLTTDGDLIVCSPQEKPELFHMIHGSYGTLGILTKITFKILPAKPYVKMTYKRFDNASDYWTFLKDRFQKLDYDFIDGIAHAPNHLVACLGTLVDTAPYQTLYSGENVFYKSTIDRHEDYIPLLEYFYRYDADCHWLSRTLPPLEWKPIRKYLGKVFLGSTNLIKWSGRLAPLFRMRRRQDLVVDVFIPDRNFPAFFEWYTRTFNYWPLWLVPYKAPMLYPWISDQHQKAMTETLLMDCAIYGKTNSDPSVDLSELLEKKVYELGGIKTLIAVNHYSQEEFWKIYSRERYTAAKNILDQRNVQGDVFSRFRPERYGKRG